MDSRFDFFDQTALLHRLSTALKKRDQEVVFLVGSALSAPPRPGAAGVPNVDGMIDLIRNEFDDSQLSQLDEVLQAAGEKKYQAAFLFLQGRLGPGTANEIVRRAVLAARLEIPNKSKINFEVAAATEDELRFLDLDSQWSINPGTEAIGKLITDYPRRFGRSLLTTNFDPLVEVAIRNVGGQFFRTTLHADGNLFQTEGVGCHIIHLHGYWYGSDTLHTTRQLQQSRPHLKSSLSSLLRNKLVLVCGYGGWDDVFTNALMEVVQDDAASPEILWAFYAPELLIGDNLAQSLAPGINRGRVCLYTGVDCNLFFPALFDVWRSLERSSSETTAVPTNSVRVNTRLSNELEKGAGDNLILEGDDVDRPPVVEFCVGRDHELALVNQSDARVVFLTGIGGQGKSTIAAQYFQDCQSTGKFKYFVWRDCKEESERFENQLASVLEKLSNRRISGPDLAKLDAASIVQLLLALIADLNVLFIFDNIDHYVNLEASRTTAAPDLLIQALLSAKSTCQIVFTCRPDVKYDHPLSLSCRLEGISIDATRQLFSQRRATFNEVELLEAHELTSGHAFWLDLISIQVTKPESPIGIGELLSKIRSGKGLLPDNTLNQIWATLREREQTVLRAMAETLRPETENDIADYLSDDLNYHKVMRALRILRAMNLIVVKRRTEAQDVLELHPLVRQFVQRRFSRPDRSRFIEQIIKCYTRFMGLNRMQLSHNPTLTTLQHWTQVAELDLAAGRINDAFVTLNEVSGAFAASAYPREFSRGVRNVLSSIDWVSDYGKYRAFDHVFHAHFRNLVHLGEFAEADQLLGKYELTVLERNARYILYCDMKCYSKWVRGEFADAVKWGKIGQKLKISTNVDTAYDLSHNLALAERDAGMPELALPVFLAGRELSAVLDPEELAEVDSNAAVKYGNIGRCLHFMGQIDQALICYQKSALLIEKSHKMSTSLIRGSFDVGSVNSYSQRSNSN